MRSSVTLFRLFGIDVNLHTTFILFFAVILALVGIDAFVYFALIFVFVLGHELSHSLVAKYHGIDVPEITLTFIGGIASIDIPEKPSLELRVSLAGPLFNLAVVTLAVVALSIAYPGWLAGLDATALADRPYTVKHLLINVVAINLMLGLFNVLPGFPMDGGRILRSLLAFNVDYVRATELAVNAGRYAVFPLFFLWGLASGNLVLVFIAAVLYLVSGTELEMIRLRAAYRGFAARDVMESVPPAVDNDAGLGTVLSDAGGRFNTFLVTRDAKLEGFLDLAALKDVSEDDLARPVGDFAREDYLVVEATTPVTAVLAKGRGRPRYVVAQGGRVVGVFSIQSLVERQGVYLAQKRVLPRTRERGA